ncbi:ATP-binding protein [Hominifimenecus sp. rT4P-3]|uniref:ATP-binding protein n=1 Tax=Hominifimenecus sp. rT4P-3 TaxID=3242979 RepID=UPI003DA663A8
MRCLNQELTFEAAEKEFEFREVEFGPQQMRTLKMIDQDNLYSNLGLLLSDQCLHTIKVAVFQGMDQTVFKDRREFTGSLMQQMNEVYDFIDFRNQTRATIEKLLRIDLEDIMVGISVCRNQDLANVFYRLHLIEAYGTGMSKIIKSYEGIDRPP